MQGDAELKLMDMNTEEVITIKLSGSEPKTIVIPPGVAHAFLNTEEEPFLLLAYTDELYDPADTIPCTLYEPF